MYSFSNLEPVRCSMSGSNCCFLTCRFRRRQLQWSGVHISLIISHSLLWSTQSRRWCGLWSRSDTFLGFSCFSHDPVDVVALWSPVSLPFQKKQVMSTAVQIGGYQVGAAGVYGSEGYTGAQWLWWCSFKLGGYRRYLIDIPTPWTDWQPWRYCGFLSRPPQENKYCSKASHMSFWLPSTCESYGYTIL